MFLTPLRYLYRKMDREELGPKMTKSYGSLLTSQSNLEQLHVKLKKKKKEEKRKYRKRNNWKGNRER